MEDDYWPELYFDGQQDVEYIDTLYISENESNVGEKHMNCDEEMVHVGSKPSSDIDVVVQTTSSEIDVVTHADKITDKNDKEAEKLTDDQFVHINLQEFLHKVTTETLEDLEKLYSRHAAALGFTKGFNNDKCGDCEGHCRDYWYTKRRFTTKITSNVISLFLFLSPTPTFFNIWKAKSVQLYKPDPYLATVLNCALWVFYGMPFVHPDSLLVITINGTGFVIELIYLTIYLIYSDWPKQRKVIMILMGELLFMVVLIFITLILVHGTKDRTLLVGMICIVFNIAMYAAPLTVMKRVIRSKSVKYMPFYLSLASFLNGGIWFAYSLIKFDPNLMIPNALGTLSGVIQLILYASFYRTTKWDQNDNDNQNQPQIELPNANATNQA